MNRQQRRAAGGNGAGEPPNPGSPNVGMALAQVDQLRKAGRLAQAEQLGRQVVAGHPWSADAAHLLGLITLQLEKPQIALELIDRAIAIDPRSPPFHNNRGSTLRALGRTADAAASFRRAVSMRPDYVRAWLNLGRALCDLDQPTEGIDAYRRAIALAPDNAEACWSLGAALHGRGALDEAGDLYARALDMTPASVEILENLAKVRIGQSRIPAAIACLRALIELKPDSYEYWGRLGSVLELDPDFTGSIEAFHKAMSLKPDYPDAHNGLGGTLANLGRLEEAAAAYKEAVRLKPDYLEAHSNLLMMLHSLSSVSAADLLEEARRYAPGVTPRPAGSFANLRDPDRRLRIGYVSPDFRVHPVGFFLDRVLPAHDAGQFEIILYSDAPFTDELTDRLRAAAGRWRPIVRMSHTDVARMMEADGIDILVDLTGHTGANRLPVFAARAAPVQASWLGYFGTTGVAAMDYIIADEIVIPPGEEGLFSEAPIRLPSPYLCWSPPEAEVAIGPPPAQQQGFITFGSFNNPRKITAEVIAVWARILHAVEGSRLFLKYWAFADPACRAGFTEAIGDHGVAAERLSFEGLTPRVDALGDYNRIDIALDPFPFGGCTTTADTLWMGVPVVALAGARWSGRMSRTILSTIGQDDWAAPDLDAYVETAARLAGDVAALARLRGELRGRLESSAFCDGPGFARRLEAAYRDMWRRWCASAPG